MIGVERTDFVSILTEDRRRACGSARRSACGGTRSARGRVRDQNVTLSIVSISRSAGRVTPSTSPIALRVPDVEHAPRSSRRPASTASPRPTTRASTCLLRYPTATRSACTAATRRTPTARHPDGVERVDFVSFLTQDIERAKEFYAGTLGLEIESEGESDLEFRLGQVTLDVFDPSSIGEAFAPTLAGFALRVPDVDEARAELEAKGVAFDGRRSSTSVCKQAWFTDPDGNRLMLQRRFDA